MLVSKIKPCMCKYKQIQTVKLRMAHSISYCLFDGIYYSNNYTFAKDVFNNQERNLGARRGSFTVLVSTKNDADQGSTDVAFRTTPARYEKSKFPGFGGSMVARLKLKGIDGTAPPGAEPMA
ncbi:hypothetical protein H5410_015208 [Solanum commersonii]|uniref:Uncharacterized protein n=1 Tax=Solanum commersonii TaxID=4109 RepID=A0A9J5ZT72_SOLCO|nr:hypothetical protein H5410_015208 [Solanum commersonii]